MQKNIINYFNDLIIDRVSDIELDIINHNEEVEELMKESSELFSNIMKALPEEYKKLMFTYEANTNQTDCQCFRIIYKQGFMDGVESIMSMLYKQGNDRWRFRKRYMTDEEAKKIIKEIAQLKNPQILQQMNKADRDSIIRQLQERDISIRQLARLTGLGRGVIEKAWEEGMCLKSFWLKSKLSDIIELRISLGGVLKLEQERMLALILSKLNNIEKDQQEMKADINDINKDLKALKKDVKEIKSIQNTIQEFMLSTKTAIEKYEHDHRFIEQIRQAAGE